MSAGKSGAACLDICRKCEFDLARIQGVEAPVKIDLADNRLMHELLVSIRQPLPPEQMRVIDLVEDDDGFFSHPRRSIVSNDG